MPGKIYISTGERSGEIHAASLCEELLKKDNTLTIHGMGGEILKKSGVSIFKDASNFAVTGITEVVRNILEFKKLLKECSEFIIFQNFDTVILVDYPGFNMRLAKMIKAQKPEIKIIYYICPKFWAWNYRRIKKIRKYIDHVICIFPFEEKMLRDENIPATFVGNPLLDQLDFNNDGEYITRMFKDIRHKELIGIFPGSRKNEIEKILPVLVKTTAIIKKKLKLATFVIGTPKGIDRKKLENICHIKLDDFIVVEGRSHDIMAACDFILAKSGTTTLETALFGKPMIAVYFVSKLTAFIGRILARVEHYTLPNILTYDFCSDEKYKYIAVPEIFQEEATPQNIAAKTIEILENRDMYDDLKVKLINIRNILGNKGASEKAAGIVLNTIAVKK